MKSRKFEFWEMNRSFMGPKWRWKQAERLANGNGPYGSIGIDELTRRTAGYLKVYRSGDDGPDRVLKKYPEVSAAVHTWNNDVMVEQIKILVIANCQREEIAARLQIDEQIVAVIEDLFFDVRWALDASGWVVCRVIIPETQAGAFDLTAKLKLAYFGGSIVARAILDSRVRQPTKAADRIFDREVLLHLKFQEAMEAPLDERERLKYLELYLRYDISRRQLKLDKEKFAHQCAQDKRQEESEGQVP